MLLPIGYFGLVRLLLARCLLVSLMRSWYHFDQTKIRSVIRQLNPTANVMAMLRAALDQANAFPHGLYWTAPRLAEVGKPVQDLIAHARIKGVSAYLVEAGTFDTMLMRLWRQQPQKPAECVSLKLEERNRGGLSDDTSRLVDHAAKQTRRGHRLPARKETAAMEFIGI